MNIELSWSKFKNLEDILLSWTDSALRNFIPIISLIIEKYENMEVIEMIKGVFVFTSVQRVIFTL